MQVTQHNDVKVYNLAAGKSLPDWLNEAKKKHISLRYNQEFRKRIDLLQDFEFPIASQRVRPSPDGKYICATGIYAPEVKLFETRELGLKHARGLNHEVVDFMFLSEDYRKLVFLQDDRTVEFHSQYGRHHKLRVPKAGRSLAYDTESCHLLVGGSSKEVVRIDLEAGIFQAPIVLGELDEVNQLAVNPLMPVVSCCGNDGLVETYDLRDPSKRLQSLKVCEESSQITCCEYAKDGMHFAAGTGEGIIRVFDVRSRKPLAQRDMMNGYPVRSVVFHTGHIDSGLMVGSADSKSVKVWKAGTGDMVASLEHTVAINSIAFCPGTGLMFVANDQPRIGVYFVPSLGVAPGWCSFLDNMTEELEESSQNTVFDDYQFVTTDKLAELGAQDLVGTKFLQPYMHGYFMDHRLHARLQAAMNPFAFEEYRKKMVKDKLEKRRKMRTIVRKKGDKGKVNTGLRKKLELDAEDGEAEGVSKTKRNRAAQSQKLLEDDRFSKLFMDEDFAISSDGPTMAAPMPDMPSILKKTGLGGKASRKRAGK